jgi:sec-independent protein translocase protein TatB
VLAIFNSLGGGEVIAILIIGLIVLGPEKLPDAIRRFGNIYGEFRRMSQGFQSELRDAFDEPLQSLRGTAPVIGGGATAQPADATATEVASDGTAAGEVPVAADEVPSAVEEVQAPVEDDEVPAGSAAATWAAERTNGAAPAPAAAAPAMAEAEVEPEVREDEEPVLAEAGLLVSEPEMPTDSSEDEERPG